MYDLLFQGGEVIDGAGAARRRADVAIHDGRIASIGAARPEQAQRAIDASGLVIAPGFIDIHSHADRSLLGRADSLAKISQGFTTEAVMVDGIGFAPLDPPEAAEFMLYWRGISGLGPSDCPGWPSIADFMQSAQGSSPQNTLTHVPYSNLRVKAMGWGSAPPGEAQIEAMRDAARRGMQDGAAGLSTGLDYISQCFASTGEIAKVCEATAEFGGIYVTHVRYDLGTVGGIREAVEIGKRAGTPVHISHLKGLSEKQTEEILDYIDRVATQEVEFSFDAYPYLASSTLLSMLLPYWVWDEGPREALRRLRGREIRDELAKILCQPSRRLDQMRIAWAASDASHELRGRTLQDVVEQSGKAPADALCDLLIEHELAVLLVYHRDGGDALVDPFIAHEKCMIGSDGIYFEDGAVHPRVYGTAPRVLGPLVRDRKLFSLEAAVRKLTAFTAERFGLQDRGVIRQGAFADLAVFDPRTIGDKATYENPRQLSAGMRYVTVNGTLVLDEGRAVEFGEKQWPGRALFAHGQSASSS